MINYSGRKYRLADMEELIRRLSKDGCEIVLHSNLNSYGSSKKFKGIILASNSKCVIENRSLSIKCENEGKTMWQALQYAVKCYKRRLLLKKTYNL